MLQLAIDVTDGTVIYALPDAYRICMPKLRTWIENIILDVRLPTDFPIRALGSQNFVRIGLEIQRRVDSVPEAATLLNLKYHSVDKVNMLVNGHRFATMNKLLLQPRVYELKIAEAEAVLKLGSSLEPVENAPMLIEEAKARGLSVRDVAKTVLLARDDQDDMLKRTEGMRISATIRISEAKTPQEVFEIMSGFEESFHNRGL